MPSPVTTTRRRLMVDCLRAARLRHGPEHEPQFAARPTGNEEARDRAAALLLEVGADVGDRLLHRGDLLGFLVGNLGLELFLECRGVVKGSVADLDLVAKLEELVVDWLPVDQRARARAQVSDEAVSVDFEDQRVGVAERA